MAIIFAFIALFGWGTGDIFSALSSRKVGSWLTFFCFLFFSLILGVIYFLFTGQLPTSASFTPYFFALGLGFIHIVGTMLFYRALEIGNASIVGTIAGSFPIVAVILSLVVFRETVTLGRWFGIAFTFIGVILTSLTIKHKEELSAKRLFVDRSIYFAIITLFCWGIYFGLVRIPAEKIGWFWAAYAENIYLFIPLLLGKVGLKSMKTLFKNARNVGSVLIMTILARTADCAYNLGVLKGYVSVVSPIAGSSPVVYFLLTRLIFKEPLTRQQKTGIFFALTGIILISIASV